MAGTIKTAFFIALAMLAVLIGTFFYCAQTGCALPWQSTEVPTQVLLIAGSPDDTGANVAQIIAAVDTDAGTVTAVAPDSEATIAGTGYDQLKDALPFGGGAAVAKAYAQQTGADALPFIDMSASQLATAVDAMGGVRVDLPAAMDVFDGETLFTFTPGTQTVNAAEFAAVLKGRPYLTRSQRTQLDTTLAAALVQIVAEIADDSRVELQSASFETDILSEPLGTVLQRLSKMEL